MQGISAKVVGPQRRTIITLDLDLYSRSLKIQQSVGNKNWILRTGALHIAFAALHALGKTIDGSGLDTCAIESGAYTSATLRGIFGGKVYKIGVEYHITNSLAILIQFVCSALVSRTNSMSGSQRLKRSLEKFKHGTVKMLSHLRTNKTLVSLQSSFSNT